MPGTIAMSPPPGECAQCWRHAYDREVHAHLGWREDCPECVDHMVTGHPPHLIVPGRRGWW
ncbi:pRL2-8 [Streptomyces xiamenensis]|uniref:pRL2-8 n=1 Tax=Streptomyces xiamenensis TaxID=408015 RepID=UPI003D738384